MGVRVLWALVLLILVVVSLSGCGHAQTSARRQFRWTLPLSAAHTDLVCAATTEGTAFCRSAGEVRLWLAAQRALP